MTNLTENVDRSAVKPLFMSIFDESVPHGAEFMLLFGSGTAYVEFGK